MGNFGVLTLKIYDQDLVIVPSATYTNVIDAKGSAYLNRVGNGECTVMVQSNSAGIVVGNIAACYISDAIGGVNLTVCAFTIEEIHRKTQGDGMSRIRMSGRDLLGELTGYKHFVDVGEEYTSMTVAGGMAAGDDEFVPAGGNVGSVSVQLIEQDRHTTETTLYVADASAFSIGDDIAGETGTANLNQISVITDIGIGTSPAGNDVITMQDGLVDGADIGQYFYIPEIFNGDSIRIALGDPADGTYHYTRIINDPGPMQVKLEEPIPAGTEAAAGAATVVYSGQTPTTDDVNQIMDLARQAGGWVLDSTAAGTPGGGTDGGTAAGTSHSVDGANTLQLLINTNELTSEWFRLSAATPGEVLRSVDWRASSDATGVLLTMPDAQATTNSDYLLTARGIMKSLNAETRWKIATAVVAKGGTDNFNLGDKTDADPAGFTTEIVKGKWRVTNGNAAVADWIYVHYVTFDGVKEKSNSPASIIEAANTLHSQAIAYLENNDAAENFVQASGVVIHKDVLPGQGIATSYTETNWTDARTVYIVEVNHSVGADGVRYTDLLCSETTPYNRETAESRLIKTSSAGSATSSAGASGGGGGGGTTHDPVTIGSSDPTGSLTITGQVLTFQLTPGDGLTAAAKVLSVDLATDSGMQFTAGELEMGTPGAVTASSINEVKTTTHTHTVTATSDGDSNVNTLLKSSAGGGLRLDGLGINTAEPSSGIDLNGTLEFQGNQSITTTSGDLTIAPAQDLLLEPQGGGDVKIGQVADAELDVIFNTKADPEGEAYSAPGASAFTTQWKIDTDLGAGYFAYLEADQMHVRLFQADVTVAKSNGMIVTDSVAVLSANFVVPAVSSTVSIQVDDNPALGAAQVFQDDDWVRMRVFERDSGLSLYDLWGQVDTYSDNGDGTQDWTFTCRYAGVGSAAVGLTVQSGAAVIGYGKSGQGWWEVDARRNEGPFTRIGTWAGANPYTASNRMNHLMTGRLLSLTGNDEYGFYAGVSIDGPHMLLTERTAEFQDISISMLEGDGDATATMLVYALELNSDVESAVAPNGDISQSNVTRSTGAGTYFSHINENPASGQPDAQYLRNDYTSNANAWFDMEDLSHTLTTLTLEAYCTSQGFTDDKCQLRAQMFKADGVTKLTDEIKVFSESTTDGLVSISFTGIVTATDGEWAAARLKLSWVHTIIGSNEILAISPQSGIDVTIEDSSDYSAGRAITYYDTSGTEVGGLYGRFSAGNNYYLRLGTNEANYAHPMHFTNASSIIDIESFASTGEIAEVNIRAFVASAGGAGTEASASIDLEASAAGNDGVTIRGSDFITLQTSEVTIDSGVNAALLIIDQGTGDSNVLEMRSTDDVQHGMTDQASTYTYGRFRKLVAADGGLDIVGLTQGTIGAGLTGMITTVDTTETISSTGATVIRGYVKSGTNVTTMAADDNVVIMRNGSGTQWILKGNGDVYINGTQTAYDALDDVAMIRAASLLSPDAVRTQFDDMVQYNRSDLEAAGLVSGTFVNTTGFMRLHSGAIWQLHQRIAQLESELKTWKNNRH